MSFTEFYPIRFFAVAKVCTALSERCRQLPSISFCWHHPQYCALDFQNFAKFRARRRARLTGGVVKIFDPPRGCQPFYQTVLQGITYQAVIFGKELEGRW